MKIFLILNLAWIVAVSARIQPRIIKGKNAVEKQFPYQVGIRLIIKFQKTTWCSGSLIDNNWVVTAAHCIDGATSVIVRLGSINRFKPKIQYNVSSENFIMHEGFSCTSRDNDIALIQIPTVTYDDDIQKIDLPDISSSYSNERAIASGWGKTSDSPDARLIPKLKFADLQVIDNSVCERFYEAGLIKPTMLCTTGTSGSSTCYGDSGGPLVTEENSVLIGIVSFGSNTGCEKAIPDVFTRVTSYIPWIKKHTGI